MLKKLFKIKCFETTDVKRETLKMFVCFHVIVFLCSSLLTYCSFALSFSQVMQMEHKDARLKLMNEVLNGVKVNF